MQLELKTNVRRYKREVGQLFVATHGSTPVLALAASVDDDDVDIILAKHGDDREINLPAVRALGVLTSPRATLEGPFAILHGGVEAGFPVLADRYSSGALAISDDDVFIHVEELRGGRTARFFVDLKTGKALMQNHQLIAPPPGAVIVKSWKLVRLGDDGKLAETLVELA